MRRAGHEVAFLDALAEADPVDAVQRAVRAFAPDVTGISVRNQPAGSYELVAAEEKNTAL